MASREAVDPRSRSRLAPARPVHGTAAGWSATLDPAKGWESRVDGSGLIGPAVLTRGTFFRNGLEVGRVTSSRGPGRGARPSPSFEFPSPPRPGRGQGPDPEGSLPIR